MKVQENMEEAILESATELFLVKGFAATSTTEIAKKVGCNQALVHYYFRTKDKLFEAIFQNKMKFFLGSLLEINAGDLPFKEKLRRRIEAHFDALALEPKLPLFFFSEISLNPNRIESLRTVVGDLPKQALAHINAELEVEIQAGRVRPTTVENLLMTIVSLNITAFLVEPMFRLMTSMDSEQFQVFQAARKKENVEIVLRSLELKENSDEV